MPRQARSQTSKTSREQRLRRQVALARDRARVLVLDAGAALLERATAM